jgi:hypothetical protein
LGIKLTVPPSLVNTVNTDSLLHFLNLQTDQASIGITVAVIFDQEGKGLVLPTLSEEPTGRLGDKPDCENDQNTREALQDERDTPLVVVADIVCAVGDRSGGDTASEPTAVVEAYISYLSVNLFREIGERIDLGV